MKNRLNLMIVFWLVAMMAIGQKAEVTSEIVFVDLSGLMTDETIVQITKPENIEEVTRGFTPIRGKKIEFAGIVKDSDGVSSLSVNGQSVLPAPNGDFSINLTLGKGEQKIIVSVIDGQSNETIKEYFVNVQDDQKIMAGLSTEVGEYYALLIGVNEYDDPELVDLSNPISDAKALRDVLQQYYHFKHENVILIENASLRDIRTSLDDLSRKVGRQDNLLIFYAGHGYWEEESENGYWIPSDGRKDSRVDWYGNGTLIDQLRTIDSQHTLLIADACFSGGIFKTRRAFADAAPAINTLYSMPSRKAMTSGTLTEVPDKSVFLKYLIRRLETNTQKYLPSEQLFSSFRLAVINNSDVVPQYGTIQKVGDEGGDFIFIKQD